VFTKRSATRLPTSRGDVPEGQLANTFWAGAGKTNASINGNANPLLRESTVSPLP
jgi:hypothetical protein